MALVFYDLVKEITTTGGTGTFTLGGAVSGYRSFSVVGNGNTCYYAARGALDDSEWEVGLGTYASSGTTLARTTVLASSNSGSAVNFTGTGLTIQLVAPASLFTALAPLASSTTVGQSFVTLANPGAVRYTRINADNSVSALSDSDFRTAIGAGDTSLYLPLAGGIMTGPIQSSGGNDAANFETHKLTDGNEADSVDWEGRFLSDSTSQGSVNWQDRELLDAGGNVTLDWTTKDIDTSFTIGSKYIYRADGTDIPVADGGTGRSSHTAYAVICGGTTTTGAQQSLAVGATTEILVGGGAGTLPVWTTATGSGAPVRATSPTLVTPNIGAATGTSLTTSGKLTGSNFSTSKGTDSVVAGESAAGSLSSGSGNVVVGYQAGNLMPSGSTQNTVLGYRAGANYLGNAATFFGYAAGENTTASGVTLIGFYAGNSNTGGDLTAIGDQAARYNSTGTQNTAVGRYALQANTTGSLNVAVGHQAGAGNNGDYNTSIGTFAGLSITSGSNLTFIGARAGLSSTATGLSNATAIGYEAQVTQSNTVILGGTGGNACSVGIGTTAPAVALHVVGQSLSSGVVLSRLASAPSSPASGYVVFYCLDADGGTKIYSKDSGGTVRSVTLS